MAGDKQRRQQGKQNNDQNDDRGHDRAFILAETDPGVLKVADRLVFKLLVGQPLEEVEKRFIDLTLKAVGGNREEAAKALNIGQRTLYRKIKDYGL